MQYSTLRKVKALLDKELTKRNAAVEGLRKDQIESCEKK